MEEAAQFNSPVKLSGGVCTKIPESNGKLRADRVLNVLEAGDVNNEHLAKSEGRPRTSRPTCTGKLEGRYLGGLFWDGTVRGCAVVCPNMDIWILA